MTKEICLSNGMKVFVDDNDFEYLSNWNWYFCQGYACRMSSKSEGKRRVIQMHRIVLPPKTGFDTDHINGNTLDNRRSNLRYATRSQNNMNRFEKRLTSYSPFKGVCWRPIPKRWKAYIKINKKQIHYQLIHKLDIDSAGNLYVLESREPLEPDFDKMPKEQVDEYLRSHGYDPEQVGLRGKIFTEVLIKNIDLRARAEKAEKELAALYKLYEDACLTISQNEYAYDVDRQVLESELANLTARAEKAEAVINGMFPMWIAAMSYCEHGRAAALDRMRNYYNGRDNPLTSDELHALFEIQKPIQKPEEGEE